MGIAHSLWVLATYDVLNPNFSISFRCIKTYHISSNINIDIGDIYLSLNINYKGLLKKKTPEL